MRIILMLIDKKIFNSFINKILKIAIVLNLIFMLWLAIMKELIKICLNEIFYYKIDWQILI